MSEKEIVPGYLFLKKLGTGNIGTVFLIKKTSFSGTDCRSEEQYAIKIMYPKYNSDPVYVSRFLDEAEYLIKFSHPNIVKGYLKGFTDAVGGGQSHPLGSTDKLYYFIMEYLEGETLADVIKRTGKFQGDKGELRALFYIGQIASALEFLHSNGVVHRDVKPDNIMVLKNHQIKLLDLGFAKRVENNPEKPQEDITCGTPAYMSPEQAMGLTTLDIRSDIYSLGATLYHLVFGETPFKGTTNLEIMAKQVLLELSSVKTKKGTISPLMQYFIEKMMAKETDLRYQTPKEIIEDIVGNFPKLQIYLDSIKKPKEVSITDKLTDLSK